MQDSKIQWTDHTFNPWHGCARVSPGCANCYAEAISKRNPAVLGTWGKEGLRVVAAESAWRDPPRWDRRAAKEGRRARVFCASIADVFEEGRPDLDAPRARLWRLIEGTPRLDWLLLTKRPGEVSGLVPGAWLDRWPANAWLGASVEDRQRAAERVPALLDVPAAVRFLSCEPLLGPLDLTPWLGQLQWVIVGGESGRGSRPCDLAWLRGVVAQCRAAGVAVFVKQLGQRACDGPQQLRLKGKGGEPDEWPEGLRVRERPAG